jgi:uncharacterized protein
MRTIDADAHVLEAPHTWDYMQPAERDFRPRVVMAPAPDGGPDIEWWEIDGYMRPKGTNVGEDTPEASREMKDVELRLHHMDELGVDVQVLYPTIFLSPLTRRPEVELALARSYNRWMADVWKLGKDRLRWAAVLPLMTMDAALSELEWSRERGACAVFIRGLEGERHLTDPYFYPLYEEAQRLDLPLTVHIANGNPTNADLVRHSRFWTFRVPTVSACQVYLVSEVPTLFPKLRMGFIEAGAQWVPWVLMESRRRGLERLHEAEMLREQRVWVTCENEDDLAYIVRCAGEDNLLIGTDYGHTDPSSNIQALNMFVERPDVSDAVKKKIVDTNARAYYGIKDDELPAPAARQTTAVGS